MIKKILLILLIFGIFVGNSYADGDVEDVKKTDEPKICETDARNKINCSKFEIKTSIFSPGSKDILNKAKEGGGDTKESAKAILAVIIKTLL
ncbi:MAG: hypothetical protein Q9M97_03660 [Candidatus Gracilibacteria bacterium]|nr:hypothetical protein [Candidatus Gracilibacteria bacterium]